MRARLGILLPALILAVAPRAFAVPSFARQTGLACSSCHTIPPELTPLGRLFKLNGYTMTGIKEITSPKGQATAPLNLLEFLPLSADFQLSETSLNKPRPGFQNSNFELPQTAGLYLAGAMSSHVGAFIQVSYSAQADHFSWDMTDVRYANDTTLAGKDLIYGVTVNNQPTFEDLWNDTPAEGFPWVGPDAALAPMAGALVDNMLMQDVGGVGVYAMWNDHFYGDVTGYRSAHLGVGGPNPGTGYNVNIQGIAPYWRFAWQQTKGNNYFEFGTFGMHVRSTPNAVVGPQDRYNDYAADFQFERSLPLAKRNDLISVHGVYIHENADLQGTFAAGGAAYPQHDLNTFRLDATYHIANKYASSLGFFSTTGTTDPMLYMPGAVTGSATGDPRSNGLTSQISYWPVENILLAVQYTDYFNYQGRRTDYDGAGRNAADNNALYVDLAYYF